MYPTHSLENDCIQILKTQMEPAGSGFLESSHNQYPCLTSQSSTVECQSIPGHLSQQSIQSHLIFDQCMYELVDAWLTYQLTVD